MEKSDVAYIKALLWGIAGLCRNADLPDPIFWLMVFYMVYYGLEFVHYKLREENGE